MQQPQQPQINFQNCRKIFIARDFSDGCGVKFQNRFPPELEGKIQPKIYCSFENLSAERKTVNDRIIEKVANLRKSSNNFLPHVLRNPDPKIPLALNEFWNQYKDSFSSVFEGRIDRAQFEFTVNTMNNMYAEAEKANCATFTEGDSLKTIMNKWLHL